MIAGIAGSVFVIAVNGWMNNPTGFDARADGEVTDVEPFEALFNTNLWHEVVHMYLAGFIVAGVPRRRRLRRGVAEGQARPLSPRRADRPAGGRLPRGAGAAGVGDWAARTVAEDQPTKLAALRGSRQDDRGRRRSPSAASTTTARSTAGSRSPTGSRCSPTTTPTRPCRASTPSRPTTGRRSAVVRNAFQVMVGDRHRAGGCSRPSTCSPGSGAARLPRSKWFYRPSCSPGPAALVALIAGWITTEVGRQPWIVYEVMRTEEAVTGAEGIPVGYATLGARLPRRWRAVVFLLLRRLARQPESRQELRRRRGR